MEKLKNASTSASLPSLIENWLKITSNPVILDIVKEYQIPFLESKPFQLSPSTSLSISQRQMLLVDQQIQQFLRKTAINLSTPSENQYLSLVFLVPKKASVNRPVVNSKRLNQHILHENFKMEGLFLLKLLLQKRNCMCNVDLKDGHSSVPLHQESQELLKFKLKDSLYQFF